MAQARATGKRKTREQLLIKAIEVNPGGDEAYARLAIMLMEYPRRREEAFGLANKAIESNPGNARAWLVLGYLHQLKNERKASRDAYAKCAAGARPTMLNTSCCSRTVGLCCQPGRESLPCIRSEGNRNRARIPAPMTMETEPESRLNRARIPALNRAGIPV